MSHFILYVLIISASILTSVGVQEKDLKYTGRYGSEPTHYELVIPEKVSPSGEFISHVIPHHYKLSYFGRIKRSADVDEDENHVHYRLPIAGEDHHLQLRPTKRLLAPGAVVERQVALEDGNVTTKTSIRRVRDVQCLYQGFVKGQQDSSVAMSTCYGLAGYIRTRRGHFVVEPVHGSTGPGDPQPHLVYQRQSAIPAGRENCATQGELEKMLVRRAAGTPYGNQANMYVCNTTDLNLELLLVLDRSFLDFHKELDVENYVLTVMNMAHDMFQQTSLGIPINLAIVRIIRLEAEEYQLNMSATKDAATTLDYFRKWQMKLNPGDDSHPNHHDLALLFTRADVYERGVPSFLMGAARIAGVCDPHNQAAICRDTGLVLGFIIAHQIGHTLGMMHDGTKENGCNATLLHDLTTVMAPEITIRTGGWSPCSGQYFKLFLDSGFGKCLLDHPTDHPFDFVDMLPGVLYDGEWQCKSTFGPAATLCDTGPRCDTLKCSLGNEGCVDSHWPPAPGTSCADNKWCYHGECIQVGERPGAVDGRWGPWSPWSECSRTCGSGVSYAERRCDSPQPANGGKACVGLDRKYKICSSDPCDVNMPKFRDLQCAQFNDWIYPEDGQTHSWKAHPMPHEDPCALFCRNEKGNVAELAPRVVDGTKCMRGIRDICISGKCREIPCDMNIDSHAVEDVCGICHGDGTTCTLKKGLKFFQAVPLKNKMREIVKLIDLPEDSQNIKIEEVDPSQSKIQVRSVDGKKMFVTGNELGMFDLAGSKAWLGMIRMNQEALNIPGPISEPLSVWVSVSENVTLKYSLAARTDPRVGSFYWDFVDWSPCSAICGPGVRVSVARCVERISGVVDDDYCVHPKPEDKVKQCELTPCLPRWIIGDWQKCDGCNPQSNTPGEHSRLVRCMKPAGAEETELILLPDSDCQGPKPKERESCNSRKKRKVFHRPYRGHQKAFDRNLQAKRLHLGRIARREASDKNLEPEGVSQFSMERGKTIIDKINPNCIKFTVGEKVKTEERNIVTQIATIDSATENLQGTAALEFLKNIKHRKAKEKI